MRVVCCTVVGLALLAGSAFADETFALKTQKEKVSYIIGTDIGNNFKKQGIDIEPDIVIKGIKDALSGNKSLLSEKEATDIMTAYKQEFMTKQAEASKVLGEKNKKDGAAYLAENGKKEGVKTLPSGLQYKILADGTGKSPKATDTVVVNYRGMLIDGTEFDSSFKRGQSATFPVNGVIPGWTEALQLMKEGSRWQIVLPSNIAYGERGAGGSIGPNAVLIFEVELVEVKAPAAVPAK
ncbi:MAG: FKBP-type peptidyl-prolyl cis-trans isomerase [Thermodesulfovibrionales bacterium]